ncbi:telomeric repeat-binding factor 1 [Gastrophryne carolinensis]
MFSSLCHYFIHEHRAEEFQHSIRAMEVLLEAMPALDSERMKAVTVAQFLARVQQGKHPDVQFEEDEQITPLEAAAKVVDQFDEESEDLRNLHTEIKKFVKIQAVAVCMEKGKFKMASEVLDRQFDESDENKYLRMKLLMVIGKKDPYHEFLENFSYSIMLKKIKSYLSVLLAGRPPCFLLQAATKVVEARAKGKLDSSREENQGCENQTSKSVEEDEDSFLGDNGNSNRDELDTVKIRSTNNPVSDSQENELPENHGQPSRSGAGKKKQGGQGSFLSIRNCWFHENGYGPYPGNLQGGSVGQDSPPPSSHDSSDTGFSITQTAPMVPQPWTWEEDELLKKGVRKYGVGNWRKILESFEFNNRTGVMLKDRWRTMKKLNMVND